MIKSINTNRISKFIHPHSINKKRSEEGKEILNKEEEKRVIRKVTKEEKRKTKTAHAQAAQNPYSELTLSI